ncbi:aminoglycoside phosphotransferase [Paenibacillus marchantiophytorum]|uniref:Aminoglycoside phosphotransferase n=1 Tax=Paenibacillus marchantiophytorum TaxID=1619310 RepID=A0ABQ2BQE6_9BACL|nr:aminoglycoside phosphotransferase family protein [Paenibacillus marchantiophytorum]GGI45107.1 aminoglycoside phosphotransferase [Paenibacillus marchantiophytorum]
MKRLGEGRTAEIYDYAPDRVLKLYRIGFPKEAIVFEFETNLFISSLGISSPKAFELIEHDGRVGIVFQYVEGHSFLQKITQNPQELIILSTIFADLHLQMHNHVLQTDRAVKQIRNQKVVLTENIHNTTQLSHEEKRRIILYLEKLPQGNCLCHGDFHPDNVMVGEQEWIIDWMTGMIGNAAGDIARTLLLLTYGTLPDGAPSDIIETLHLTRNKMKDTYLNQYLVNSKLQIDDINQWMLPVAAARLSEWIPEKEKEALLMLIRERLEQLS